MPFQRLLSVFLSNPRLVETLSDTKLVRRAAQISVGMYNRFKVASMGFQQKNNLIKNSSRDSENGFFSNFKDELLKEHKKMKKEGNL
ncbi:uncharacterized protein LOC143446331 [Clavelina lepadiformis]|uniref:Uncharacterized protein n=1 Tax=Clavelina lepadiformis TaxID=159417 RepID=A0ABP0FV39_CLALP